MDAGDDPLSFEKVFGGGGGPDFTWPDTTRGRSIAGLAYWIPADSSMAIRSLKLRFSGSSAAELPLLLSLLLLLAESTDRKMCCKDLAGRNLAGRISTGRISGLPLGEFLACADLNSVRNVSVRKIFH